jgi:hypothetical protein
MAKRAAAERKVQVSADSLVRGERDRLSGEVRTRLQESAAPPARNRLAARDVTMLELPLCFDLARSSAALENEVPPRVRLVDVRGPAVGERALRQVEVPGAVPASGEWFWWMRADGALAIVRIGPNGELRYEAVMTGAAATDVRAVPQRCP